MPRIFEAYPNDIRSALERRDLYKLELPRELGGVHTEAVLRILKERLPGETLKVAFLGGDSRLHADIAAVASDWTCYGKIVLDFGFDQAKGTYRQWTRTDKDFSADIRIGFGEKRYWSLVGKDSTALTVTCPSMASMNFADFNISRPENWRGIVLHEFGHALGFEHEHQHPIEGCNEEFRWEDELGYIATMDVNGSFIPDSHSKKPGIYTILGGYPNYWPKKDVDSNIKQVLASEEYYTTSFDKKSIMTYFFPDWMFKKGKDSRCFILENRELSDGDKKAMADAYPFSSEGIDRINREKYHFLMEMIKIKFSNPDVEREFKSRLAEIK